ncbi:hypothetical protein [Marinilactibacillus kalidii]|uniref:hypothetical protein n=1 Tax=Marinilactibacillus kalidii TaxID=2820274 RepID=UPI001ABE347F|nr:hypothetical protein [Marinilactibacillus kalidii]
MTSKLPKNGYTDKSNNHFLLNAGAVVRNLEWDAENEWTYEEFGASSGGSSLSLVNTLRHMEIDGVTATPVVGGDVIEATEGTIELNILEFTRGNIQAALMASYEASDGLEFPVGYDVIRPNARIEESAYIKNLAYIGTYGKSELPIIVIFDYAICTSGLEFEPQDNNDNTMTMTFSARTNPEKVGESLLPVRILLPQTNEI